ncbi:MAG: phosphatidate cytidylyltransferase [Spirochaetaceae bacterium]|nr:phosphatidate cytidylyltransferase [Spirochaetaceae bacterium]
MKTVAARLAVFFIGFPACVAFIVLLPQKNHLAANLVISLLSAFGALEFANILRKKLAAPAPPEAFLLGVIPPVAVSAAVSLGWPFRTPAQAISLLAAWILVSNIFRSGKTLDTVIERVAASFALLFYPSIFLCWMILINTFLYATFFLVFFMTIVVIADSLGWLFGVLFGKGNRNIIPVSPNKSAAGYAGSFLGVCAASVAAASLFPAMFAGARVSPRAAALVLGLVTAVASQLGDLAESAIKRSADVKDSGGIMPGRGGILDSVDSLAFAAPFFYCCYRVLFG